MDPGLAAVAGQAYRDLDTSPRPAGGSDVGSPAVHQPAQAPAAAGAKRKQAAKPGRDICWVAGCRCSYGLKGVPNDRVADATFVMKNQMGISFGDADAPRRLPENKSENRLCARHLPTLPRERVLGAAVLLMTQGRFVRATVTGPAPSEGRGGAGRAVAAAQGARAPRPHRWRAEGGGVHEDLEEVEIWKRAALLASYERDVKSRVAGERKEAERKLNTLRHQMARLRSQVDGDDADEDDEEEGDGGEAMDSEREGTPTALPRRAVRVRVPVPDGWQPGDPINIELAAGHVEGSRAGRFVAVPRASDVADGFAHVEVLVTIDAPPAQTKPVKEGNKAAQLEALINSRASTLGLVYNSTPNPLNPKRTWPLREQFSFANLRPEFFQLAERQVLMAIVSSRS